MTDDQLREWASKAASEIVKREGAALALSVSDRNESAIEADSNLLGIAIAQAIIEASKEVGFTVPLVVRLEGTEVNEGKKMLKDSGLAIISADDLTDAAKKVVASIA